MATTLDCSHRYRIAYEGVLAGFEEKCSVSEHHEVLLQMRMHQSRGIILEAMHGLKLHAEGFYGLDPEEHNTKVM